MIKKISYILGKIVLGFFAFYLFLGFMIIPFVLKWGIESQGTKILKTPVSVRSVYMNPIMLSVVMNGVEIRDTNKQMLVGFEKLDIDVSFLAFFKKMYRIESVKLDGFQMNPALLKDGKINLMAIVPAAAEVKEEVLQGAKKEAPSAVSLEALPRIVIDGVYVNNAQVHFTDETVTPRLETSLHKINVVVTGLSTDPSSGINVVSDAQLDARGVVSLEALIKPFIQPLEMEASFTLNKYALKVLSSYVGKYTGRALDAGDFDIRMDYRISNNKITASHKILIQDFTFGKKVESKDALPLPFGLALALLEDSKGQIKIALPVTGDMSAPDFKYWPLVGQVARSFLFKVVSKPFSFLGALIGSENENDELGYVRFVPGKAELSDAEKKKIETVVLGLKERPRLLLAIPGGYDPEVDWKAMKTDRLLKDYEALRKESTKDDRKIYEMLYQRSFGVKDLWKIMNQYKTREGVYDDAKAITEIKRQLVENAPADKAVMAALAEARAKVVYDAFIELGFDAARISIIPSVAVQAGVGYVPLEFTLTVVGDAK